MHHHPITVNLLAMAGQVDTFGQTLAPVRMTVPTAIVISLLLIAYWGISRRTTPRSRRRLRRANSVVIFALAWSAVYALSVANLDLSPSKFIAAWLAVFGTSALAIVLAFFDSINNVRIIRKERRARRQERNKAISALKTATT